MTNNQLNQTILTNMLDTKNKIENGALLKKRAFFIQSTNFHGLSMNHILAIHSQNPVATDLRSFDEWKKVKRSITLGEKATFLLTNYSDKQSKRIAVFDISQTTGQNYNVNKTDEKILGESLAILSEQALGDFSTVGDYLHAYVHDFAEKGLRNYDKLTQEEKGYVSVVGEYTLCQAFGLKKQKQQVLTQLEKGLFVNSNVRFISIIQVGNNMSTTLINSINQVQNLATVKSDYYFCESRADRYYLTNEPRLFETQQDLLFNEFVKGNLVTLDEMTEMVQNYMAEDTATDRMSPELKEWASSNETNRKWLVENIKSILLFDENVLNFANELDTMEDIIGE